MGQRTSSKCELVSKCVAFNILNQLEKRLLDHVNQQTNVSRYFKHLVEWDMGRSMIVSVSVPDRDEAVYQKQSEDDLIAAWE